MVSGKDAIQEVKERADIVQVIGEKVHLSPSGGNFKGLCPFHGEKTPSFMVNPQRQWFHCFGCGKGGSVIDFVMEFERLTFPEALKNLAERYGVALDGPGGKPEPKSRQLEALQMAMGYYHENLARQPLAEAARRYLLERDFDERIWQAFMLGFAPDGWQGFTDLALGKGYRPDELLGTGLVKQGNTGRLYDLLRKRVVYPIFNNQGRPIAFGGRVIDPADNPKYLNTPETAHYHKSKVLYGFHLAKDRFRQAKRAVLVEGYMDVLRMHQHGLAEAVATCGTALTPDHVALLERHVGNVLLVFDADAAGAKAALRSAPLFLNKGVGAQVVTLPQGQDPDDFLRQQGAPAFEELAANATPLLEHVVFEVQKAHGATPQGREKALQELVPLLSAIQKEATRDLTVRHLADLMGVEARSLLKLLRPASQQESFGPRGGYGATGGYPPGGHPPGGMGREAQPGGPLTQTPFSSPATRHERLVLQLLSLHRELLALCRQLLAEADFTDEPLQRLYGKWLRLSDEEFAHLSEDELAELFPEVAAPLRALTMEQGLQAQAVADPATELKHLAARMKEHTKKTLLKALRQAQGTPQEEPLMRRLQETRRQLDGLKAPRKPLT